MTRLPRGCLGRPFVRSSFGWVSGGWPFVQGGSPWQCREGVAAQPTIRESFTCGSQIAVTSRHPSLARGVLFGVGVVGSVWQRPYDPRITVSCRAVLLVVGWLRG